jgi:hypothetical protein
MRIQVRQRGRRMTGAAKSAIERQLALALGRFGDRIATVTVALWSDGDASARGGNRCQIDVSLTPVRKVSVEDSDPDLLVAAARTAQRLRRAVAHVLEVERDVDRRLAPSGPLLPPPPAARKARAKRAKPPRRP